MDLFEYGRQKTLAATAPLAHRMRPRTLAEFVGQAHILGEGKFLRRAIERGLLTSAILFGPPGTGKTTLARIWAGAARAHFAQLNAVTAGVADLRRVVAAAQERLGGHGARTALFIDEIHRFNKAQQDALLPFVEDGTVVLIGATVTNPLVSVAGALLSRCRLVELRPLAQTDIRRLVEQALSDAERGLAAQQVRLEPTALDHLIRFAGGDGRVALGGLEMAVQLTDPDADGCRRVSRGVMEEVLQQQTVVYDRDGDEHYHVSSAFIKSMRGSDPDAALYWLARMLHAGEDPRFIVRRLLVHAAEDVGMADPQALVVAAAAAAALEQVGLPEARIPIAQAVVYIACAPKSNAVYRAINRAMEEARTQVAPPVPLHLRDPGYGAGDRLGYGQDYLYPHDYPDHWVPQQYLPDGCQARYYEPSAQGREAWVARRQARRRMSPRQE